MTEKAQIIPDGASFPVAKLAIAWEITKIAVANNLEDSNLENDTKAITNTFLKVYEALKNEKPIAK